MLRIDAKSLEPSETSKTGQEKEMNLWKCCILCASVIITLVVFSEEAFSLVPSEIQYRINVSLDVEQKILYGEEVIFYTSGADIPLHALYLHVYPNVFRGRNSTAGQEAEEKLRDYTLAHSRNKDLGYIGIDSLRVNDKASEFSVDGTVMRIDLSTPLMPRDTIVIKMDFQVKIPKVAFRFGYTGKHFTIAQWYPKIAVYDEEGWHPDEYHLIGEFYGDFASFDVSISLPQDYYVGSTGYLVQSINGDNNMPLISEDENAGNSEKIDKNRNREAGEKTPTKTLMFHAEKVHDFAWVASPDYVRKEAEWSGTLVRALVFKRDSKKGWKNLLTYSLDAIKFYSEQIGEYPYRNLTVVEAYTGGAGGMEYPTLSMIDPGANTPFMRILEFVTVHEICHNWWYGMVASDELNDAWLDEGFTEYFTVRYAEWKYEKGDVFDLPKWVPLKIEMPYATEQEWSYLQYARSGRDRIVAEPVYMLDDHMMYGAITYSKGSKILDMLNYVIGDSLFSEFIKSYFSQYRFKHPTIQDVIEVAEQTSGQQLDWFFDQWLYTTKKCDYAVGSISREKTNGGEFITRVEIKREGEIVMPVEVEAVLANGGRELQRIFADDKIETPTFRTKERVNKIRIDPRHRLLEVDRLNNESGLLPPIRIRVASTFDVGPAFETDAYLIRFSPTIWYNDVDELKLGAKMGGSYLSEVSSFSLGASYATKTEAVDYGFAYSTPLSRIPRFSVRLDLNRSNGMRSFGADIRLGDKPLTSVLQGFGLQVHYPLLRSCVELSYSDRYDSRYFDEKWFSLGKTTIVSLNTSFIHKSYHGFTQLNLDLSRGLGILNADYAFNRLFTSASQEFRLVRTGELIAYLRGSLGYADGNVPTHQKLDVALGVPSSSVDPIGLLINTGGGGVRGYRDRAILGKKLHALNFELRSEILKNLPFFVSPCLFFDLGKIEGGVDSEIPSEFLYDAGFELRFMDMLYLSLPLWLSQPDAGEKEFEFRALVGIRLPQ